MANETKCCPDCAVEPGKNHMDGCDVERCGFCGGQAISCCCWQRQLAYPKDTFDEPTEEMWEIWYKKRELQGLVPWTGEWPGIAECREYDLWCYQDSKFYGDPAMHYGHIPCNADHPKAGPDLNRVYTDLVWDRNLKKFIRKVSTDVSND